MEQDLLTAKLVASVKEAGLEDSDKITAILEMSAARDLTILEMEKHSDSESE